MGVERRSPPRLRRRRRVHRHFGRQCGNRDPNSGNHQVARFLSQLFQASTILEPLACWSVEDSDVFGLGAECAFHELGVVGGSETGLVLALVGFVFPNGDNQGLFVGSMFKGSSAPNQSETDPPDGFPFFCSVNGLNQSETLSFRSLVNDLSFAVKCTGLSWMIIGINGTHPVHGLDWAFAWVHIHVLFHHGARQYRRTVGEIQGWNFSICQGRTLKTTINHPMEALVHLLHLFNVCSYAASCGAVTLKRTLGGSFDLLSAAVRDQRETPAGSSTLDNVSSDTSSTFTVTRSDGETGIWSMISDLCEGYR